MHLFQATKLACKSLWTNKIRSLLTMLGIIIGVMAISLLSTVASGVTDAVVSSIRSQSTLAAMMNTSDKLTYNKAIEIIEDIQPENKDAVAYFDYSLVYSGTSLVANAEKSIIEQDTSVLSYLTAQKLYRESDFNFDELTEEEAELARFLTTIKKGALGTTVYAVDNNFKDVYNLKFTGDFPSNSSEILVDDVFLETFFKSERLTSETAIGRTVTLGTFNYTEFTVKFPANADIDTDTITALVVSLKTGIPVKVGEGENEETVTIKFNVIKNENGKDYIYDRATKTVKVKIEIFKYATNEELKEMATKFIETLDSPLNSTTIEVKDIYDLTNAREYTICGVFSEDENSMISNISSVTSSASDKIENSLLMAFMHAQSGVKGTCYTLISDETVTCLSNGKQTNYTDSKLGFAYFRYKTEENMNASTTNLVVGFSKAGYKYMTDFMLVSFSSVANIISNIMGILTIMLTVISAISLVVGGIGIMNIMLVAVSERTREIGIRKAIGAKKFSILSQFLVEALTISLIGGIIGLGISAIGTIIISNYMGIALVMPTWVILMSVGFCTAIGLIFGMFPAIKASNMQPIDALRRE